MLVGRVREVAILQGVHTAEQELFLLVGLGKLGEYLSKLNGF